MSQRVWQTLKKAFSPRPQGFAQKQAKISVSESKCWSRQSWRGCSWTAPGNECSTSLLSPSHTPFLPPCFPSSQEINSLVGSHIFFFLLIFRLPFSILEPLSSSDNTARILTRRSGFRQQEQSVFYLPILIADNGQPVLSSTGTLTIQVCSCDDDGHVLSCSPEAYMLPVSLSWGALIAILACIFVLLGKWLLSIL